MFSTTPLDFKKLQCSWFPASRVFGTIKRLYTCRNPRFASRLSPSTAAGISGAVWKVSCGSAASGWKSWWWTTPPPTTPATSWPNSADRIRLIPNRDNVGFAAAQNQAIRSSRAEWVLTLNPDVLMEDGLPLASWWTPGEMDPATGVVCGKLLSIGPGFRPLQEPPNRFHRPLLYPGAASLRPRLASTGRWRLSTGPNMSSEPAPRPPSTAGG